MVGVLEKREQFLLGGGGDDQNAVIYMPFNVARKLKPTADDVYILAVARTGMMDEAQDQITDMLRVRRQVPFGKPDNFGLQTAELFLSNFRSILSGVAIAMVVISSVGLMVGGIGVMNIMLVSVTERTREIGVRKAIGARRSDILWQFLIEAATLTGFGGLVGLTIGWLLTFLLRLVLTFLCSAVGADRWLRRQRGHRFDIWNLAGMESRPAGSNRITPIRVSNLCCTCNHVFRGSLFLSN